MRHVIFAMRNHNIVVTATAATAAVATVTFRIIILRFQRSHHFAFVVAASLRRR